jgi:hypothetical protein
MPDLHLSHTETEPGICQTWHCYQTRLLYFKLAVGYLVHELQIKYRKSTNPPDD